jgi:hypothetical protein
MQRERKRGMTRGSHVTGARARESKQLGRAVFFLRWAEMSSAAQVRSLSLFLLFSVLFHFVFNFQI